MSRIGSSRKRFGIRYCTIARSLAHPLLSVHRIEEVEVAAAGATSGASRAGGRDSRKDEGEWTVEKFFEGSIKQLKRRKP